MMISSSRASFSRITDGLNIRCLIRCALSERKCGLSFANLFSVFCLLGFFFCTDLVHGWSRFS